MACLAQQREWTRLRAGSLATNAEPLDFSSQVNATLAQSTIDAPPMRSIIDSPTEPDGFAKPTSTPTDSSSPMTTITAAATTRTEPAQKTPSTTVTKTTTKTVSSSTQESHISLQKTKQPKSATPSITTAPTPAATTKPAQQSDAKRTHLLTCALAAYAGIVDVICLQRHGCYVNMLTGNSIKSLSALVNAQWREGMKHAGLVGAYTFGTILYRSLITRGGQIKPNEAKKSYKARVLATAFVIWFIGDVMAYTKGPSWQPLFLTMGFGVLNPAAMDLTGVINWAMTGHMGRVGFGVVDKAREGKSPSSMHASGQIMASFLIGTLVTAYLHSKSFTRWMQSGPLSNYKLVEVPIGLLFSAMYSGLLHWYLRGEKTKKTTKAA
jgi:uncharacterized membrane protein YoaK (UPF0700 family)